MCKTDRVQPRGYRPKNTTQKHPQNSRDPKNSLHANGKLPKSKNEKDGTRIRYLQSEAEAKKGMDLNLEEHRPMKGLVNRYLGISIQIQPNRRRILETKCRARLTSDSGVRIGYVTSSMNV